MLLVLKQQEELESLKEEVNVLKSSVHILIKTKEDKNQEIIQEKEAEKDSLEN